MLTEYKIIHLGDLYRFYVDESGEVVCVQLYVMMGTNEQELDVEDISPEVMELFETKYMS